MPKSLEARDEIGQDPTGVTLYFGTIESMVNNGFSMLDEFGLDGWQDVDDGESRLFDATEIQDVLSKLHAAFPDGDDYADLAGMFLESCVAWCNEHETTIKLIIHP